VTRRLQPRRPIGARRIGRRAAGLRPQRRLWGRPLALTFRSRAAPQPRDRHRIAAADAALVVVAPRLQLAIALSNRFVANHVHHHLRATVAAIGRGSDAAAGAAQGRRETGAPIALTRLNRPVYATFDASVSTPPSVRPSAESPPRGATRRPTTALRLPLRAAPSAPLRLAAAREALAPVKHTGPRVQADLGTGGRNPARDLRSRRQARARLGSSRSVAEPETTQARFGSGGAHRSAPSTPRRTAAALVVRGVTDSPGGTRRLLPSEPFGRRPAPLEYRREDGAAAAPAPGAAPPAFLPPAPVIDLDAISREVIGRIETRLRIERERRGRH
jgi:hypothetical protein